MECILFYYERLLCQTKKWINFSACCLSLRPNLDRIMFCFRWKCCSFRALALKMFQFQYNQIIMVITEELNYPTRISKSLRITANKKLLTLSSAMTYRIKTIIRSRSSNYMISSLVDSDIIMVNFLPKIYIYI